MAGRSPASILYDSNGNPVSVLLDSGYRRLAVDTKLGDTDQDAFGRARVANPQTVFDAKQVFDNLPLLFAEKTASGGSATHVLSEAKTTLRSGTTIGGLAIRQSRRRFNYQPAKGQVFLMTMSRAQGEAGVRKRVGLFDENNGLFLEVLETGARFVVRKNGVDTATAQASWGDPLDGTGESGITLDLSKTQIFTADFQWLGVGRVRFGFVINGSLVIAYEADHANVLADVYMRSPNLPIRWEVETIGAASGDPLLDAICCSVQSEGGAADTAVIRAADRGLTPISTDTTLRQIIALRLRSTGLLATVIPIGISILAPGTKDFRWGLYFNSAVGGTPTWTPVPNSPAEYDVSRTGAVSGGTLIASGYGSGKWGGESAIYVPQIAPILAIGSDVDGVPDEITLAVQALTVSDSYYGSITWWEQS